MSFVRSVIWKPIDGLGLELCELLYLNRWELEETVLTAFDAVPTRVSYSIVCDVLWQTRNIWINIEQYGDEQGSLSATRTKAWRVDRRARPDLADCIDVDLGITPATNTLPIRRLKLEIGESREVTAAWVRFPSLDVQPLVQTYTRLSKFEYRYQSPNFETRVLVDDLDLVIEYEKGWTRVSSSSTS